MKRSKIDVQLKKLFFCQTLVLGFKACRAEGRIQCNKTFLRAFTIHIRACRQGFVVQETTSDLLGISLAHPADRFLQHLLRMPPLPLPPRPAKEQEHFIESKGGSIDRQCLNTSVSGSGKHRWPSCTTTNYHQCNLPGSTSRSKILTFEAITHGATARI